MIFAEISLWFLIQKRESLSGKSRRHALENIPGSYEQAERGIGCFPGVDVRRRNIASSAYGPFSARIEICLLYIASKQSDTVVPFAIFEKDARIARKIFWRKR